MTVQSLASIEQFSHHGYINLESYKRNGEPKQTPVRPMVYDGMIYVNTDPKSWKAKRIRMNPHVRIVLSDRRGKPIGTWVEGEAHVLEGEEEERMLKVFKKQYGVIGSPIVTLVGRLRGLRLTGAISIKLQPQQTPETVSERT